MKIKIATVPTDQTCHCGHHIDIQTNGSVLPDGVGWAKFKKDGGRIEFVLRAICDKCGSIFDPDHKRFAPYYNMASDR